MARNIRIFSPMRGTLIPLNECPDPVFASGAMGRGVAVQNPKGQVLAPFDGEVTVLFPTGHAIGLKSNDGIELLIHVGMDTVRMNGEGFVACVEPGEVVRRGQLLLEFSPDTIRKAGYDTTTPVVVTNHADFGDITFELDEQSITSKATTEEASYGYVEKEADDSQYNDLPDAKQVARLIMKYVGGPDNVRAAESCATRLRLTVNDKSKIQERNVENIDGVKGQFFAAQQYQIICGTDFGERVTEEFIKLKPSLAGGNVSSPRKENSSKGGKDLDTKLTILGETGSGKTCYLLGMYYEMSAGRDGYSIVATDRDESRLLVTRFKNLKDASLGRARFPEATDNSQKYQFELQHAFNTILPFEWIDYPGGWLDVSGSASQAALNEIENSIYNSTALFICIDGENLIGDDTREKIDRVRDKCSRHISPYLGRLTNKNSGRKFPPVALIITKYDLCSETDEDEIREILEKSFSPLFERNDTFVVIIPVSLGSELQDDDYRGNFKPINLHLPIYMGIWFSLRDYLKQHEDKIQQARRDISNYNDLIRDEENSFFLFRNNDSIKVWRRRKSELESDIQRRENEIRDMRQSYDRLERELYDINLTYINGRWRK